ncbi:hypothetical protein Tc00.1047053503931.30 [Trypanosoma cruzi]|uniref:Protein dpy-30 homolog n=2 Tax=Trypanosoma cruzi TaxID=5693 RepID=Q4CNN8_TRYCC|nr:hypothetical protein Tc00.1047053503931.30 [Trypanosoma cruzi]EAN81890.1 hypothetical protein Tc00.1047053503931.30 [Trypanosoma cruzi]|eukprot:XP_803336.1 hypothetical protein [Trypanosoma cruzi strain CL Brener]
MRGAGCNQWARGSQQELRKNVLLLFLLLFFLRGVMDFHLNSLHFFLFFCAGFLSNVKYRKREEGKRRMRRDIPSVSTSRAEPQKQQGGHAAMTLESTRAYLDHTCVPLLMEAMAAVSRVRPDDPIDFIAHYLLKHNPNRRGTNTQHLDNDPRGIWRN